MKTTVSRSPLKAVLDSLMKLFLTQMPTHVSSLLSKTGARTQFVFLLLALLSLLSLNRFEGKKCNAGFFFFWIDQKRTSWFKCAPCSCYWYILLSWDSSNLTQLTPIIDGYDPSSSRQRGDSIITLLARDHSWLVAHTKSHMLTD